VFDSHGDIGAAAGGPDGLFHSDTRFVSHLELLLNGMQPLLLGSSIRDDNTLMTVDLTNPDMYFDNHLLLPKDTLHVVRTVFLWRDTAYQRLAVRNHGGRAIELRLSILFDRASGLDISCKAGEHGRARSFDNAFDGATPGRTTMH
jgi:glycogen debranching enzyme